MKYSILITALLAATLSACQDADRGAPLASPTPDQLTPVPPTEAAPAPAMEAAAPAADAGTPPVDGAAMPADAAAPAADAMSPPTDAAAAPAEEAAAPAASGGAVDMEASTALAKSSGCFACHHLEQKRVGPAWKDVSAKYAGDAAAKDTLVAWIKAGGTGRWQMGVMPAYSPRVSDENIGALADFILSLNK